MSDQVLHIESVAKRYPDGHGGMQTVLDDISLRVEPGEFVTVIGASGCGKSTLLRLVAGLEHSQGGVIRLGDRVVDQPGADRGMVFQHYTLFPWLTVKQNVMFSLELGANMRAIETESELSGLVDRAYALIEMMGLDDRRDHYPNQLSGGMQQRVAIARALLSRPRVLLMDEPFGALDAQTREVMHDLILQLFAVEPTTVMFVTHDVEEAAYLGDRVVVLAPHPGRIDGIHDMAWGREREPALKLDPEFTQVKGQLTERIRATSGMEADHKLIERMTALGRRMQGRGAR
ncbi:ABC transporter ATP-binding protein [Salinisphaera sp. LB1]|uniref:ABC transporter ATP-binding protein n=1 Tax=Salinisphaera sp. LB1 TaxID=2183911 RepID=UPI000D708125|nr:ABC transporter ATP-binding protein [Salinisphaera sp. LB1]AWN14657.1 Urea carboxylase-related ABC transporter, ATPase protein [Salinisphaera sp. LB1]